jgi:hypothetical protein
MIAIFMPFVDNCQPRITQESLSAYFQWGPLQIIASVGFCFVKTTERKKIQSLRRITTIVKEQLEK